ncbi:hypothetical protein J6595_01390 [Jiella sp. KSK16Y-1]|uniref:Rap1a immunity protein domain-containing protein n=2 Tax=Jiella mangrovi TaxID=2821407 RepID=A0ABS4BBW9_9HYPH|nr:hypothetical protein [Jiella mangrovi]
MGGAAQADTAMTAGVVLDNMQSREVGAYTSGILEGLMYHTALQAGGESPRVQCMYDWYYADNEKAVRQVMSAYSNYRDKYPAAIIYALIKRECGAE